MASRLSPRQIQFFKDEGYLLFNQPVLPQSKFDALKNHFERKVVEFCERSGASALMYMTIFASGAIAAPPAGKGLTLFGYPAVLSVAAFLLLLGGVLFWLLLKKYDKDAD